MKKGIKENNYDVTDKARMVKRRERIKEAGLVERAVLMDAEDAPAVKQYAEKLYKKRGKALKP